MCTAQSETHQTLWLLLMVTKAHQLQPFFHMHLHDSQNEQRCDQCPLANNTTRRQVTMMAPHRPTQWYLQTGTAAIHCRTLLL